MNKEKLEYLRNNTSLSPFNKARLLLLKSKGASQEQLDLAEYEARFSSYEKNWDKTWQKLNWGEKEDESLREFANTALEQAITEDRGKTR